MAKYKILLVDDEYMILEGLKKILDWEELGFEIVHTSKNARDALNYLKKFPVDLMITDITMPEMSGIELVEEAQKTSRFFFTIILSGYREFDYVKRGISLGVKDYLVKPVNKEELKQSVLNIKDELEKRKENQMKALFYVENQLMKWLQDELNEVEFEQMMEKYFPNMSAPYTPVLFSSAKSHLEEVVEKFESDGQKMWVNIQGKEGQKYLIYAGKRQLLLINLRQLERVLKESDCQILVGETVYEWENLYVSFDKIKQLEKIQTFYPDLASAQRIQTIDIIDQEEEELPYLSFNKALMIGDYKTIRSELDQIFLQLEELQADPEHVKTVSFLLFTDMYRQFSGMSATDYEAVIEEIRQVNTIDELKGILENVLDNTSSRISGKRYSQVVQKVMEMILTDSSKDISLKSVAEELYMNAVYLGQVFKKETELSFNQYLNQIRIKKAQDLLLHTSYTINEIAQKTGFNNTNYFSKMFKKLNGMTPKEFRDTYDKERYESV